MQSLPLFHRVSGRPILLIGEGDAAEAKARLIERAGGTIVRDLQDAAAEGARLAFVALEDPHAAADAANEARQAGMLVNVVDMPALCDFTTPAIVDRDPVLVAVGTGGASAGLAKHVRLRLEAILPATLGALAQALADGRARLRRRLPDARERRGALDTALTQGGALDPFDAFAHARVDEWLSRDLIYDAPAHTVIALRSGDPDDLTVGEARLLGRADWIVVDGDVPRAVMERARADATRVADARDRPGLTVTLRAPRYSGRPPSFSSSAK